MTEREKEQLDFSTYVANSRPIQTKTCRHSPSETFLQNFEVANSIM
jgi:hypothetical protein